MHEACLAKLSHGRVHNGVPRASVTPRVERLFARIPLDRIVRRLPGRSCRVRCVPKHLGVEVTPGNLAHPEPLARSFPFTLGWEREQSRHELARRKQPKMQCRGESTRPLFIRKCVSSCGVTVRAVAACGGDPALCRGAGSALARHREKRDRCCWLRCALNRGVVGLQRWGKFQ